MAFQKAFLRVELGPEFFATYTSDPDPTDVALSTIVQQVFPGAFVSTIPDVKLAVIREATTELDLK